MTLIKHNIFIVLLMLVTFVTQAAVGTSMSCVNDNTSNKMMTTLEMPMDNTMADHSKMAPSEMDHSKMNHATMYSMNIDASDDCCQQDCQCPMAICFTQSLSASTNSLMVLNTLLLKVQKINQLPLLIQTQINSSLYRPPIS